MGDDNYQKQHDDYTQGQIEVRVDRLLRQGELLGKTATSGTSPDAVHPGICEGTEVALQDAAFLQKGHPDLAQEQGLPEAVERTKPLFNAQCKPNFPKLTQE